AGMVLHAPPRRTEAVRASRDFSAATVACARPSWKNPSAALNTRSPAMTAASVYSWSAAWRMIAASSIHGTGAQNLDSAIRQGRIAVSGRAFGPNFASSACASPLVRPQANLSSGLTSTFFAATVGFVGAVDIVLAEV